MKGAIASCTSQRAVPEDTRCIHCKRDEPLTAGLFGETLVPLFNSTLPGRSSIRRHNARHVGSPKFAHFKMSSPHHVRHFKAELTDPLSISLAHVSISLAHDSHLKPGNILFSAQQRLTFTLFASSHIVRWIQCGQLLRSIKDRKIGDMLTFPDLRHSQQKFRDTRCVLAKRLTTPMVAEELLRESSLWPVKRVNCGIPGVEWAEQEVPDQSLLSQLFKRPELIAFLMDLDPSQFRQLQNMTSWVSRYGVGEYINSHVDRAGSIQMVLGLMNSGDKTGGVLSVSYKDYSDSILLSPGDALIFEATTVRHFTSRIAQTHEQLRPERVTAVARYFFQQA